MATSTIREPATTGTSTGARGSPQLATLGKVCSLVVAIGLVVALVIAAAVGLAALVLTSAGR
jgi:hypothetical protein